MTDPRRPQPDQPADPDEREAPDPRPTHPDGLPDNAGEGEVIRAARRSELWEVYSHGIRNFREYHRTEESAERAAQQLRDAGFTLTTSVSKVERHAS